MQISHPAQRSQSRPSYLDKIIMLHKVKYPARAGEMENCMEWRNYLEKKNFNTTLEPDPIQAYNHLNQLKLTHQNFGSVRDRKSKPGATHLGSGPQEPISGKAQAAFIHCKMSIIQQEGPVNVYDQKQKS